MDRQIAVALGDLSTNPDLPGALAALAPLLEGADSQILVKPVLPELARQIQRLAPVPGGPCQEHGALLELLDLYGRVCARLAAAGHVAPAMAENGRLGLALIGAVERYTKQMRAELEAADEADIRAVSTAVLRCDALKWVLEEIGLPQRARETERYALIFARSVLRRAVADLDRFLKSPDVEGRLALAVLLAQAEDCAVRIERTAAYAPDAGDLPEELSETLLSDFQRCLVRLAPLLLAGIEALLREPERFAALFDSRLEQIARVARLGAVTDRVRGVAASSDLELRLAELLERHGGELPPAVRRWMDTGGALAAGPRARPLQTESPGA